jgi:hypothetical protein
MQRKEIWVRSVSWQYAHIGLVIPEEEREAFTSPARAVHDCCKHPLWALFVWCENKKSNANADRCNDCLVSDSAPKSRSFVY